MLSGISIRAVAPCRIACFETQQLHELVQVNSPSSDSILRTMSQRVVDSQRYVQSVRSTRVVITSAEARQASQKVRTFLASNRIVYDWQVREEDRPSSVEDFTVAIDLIECS